MKYGIALVATILAGIYLDNHPQVYTPAMDWCADCFMGFMNHLDNWTK